ncbi:MAG: acylphosphatase [Thermoanaerobaculia bacterium]|nr:acylphosphatase [Thermoanaerobaculia bacterium]
MSAAGERAAWRVRGRVQGVGFRAFVARRARLLGLAGGARNEPDGAVVVEIAGGSPQALADLRAALATGPAAARVAAVDETAPDGRPMDVEF